MSMIQRRPGSQRRIRILSKPAPAAPESPPSRSLLPLPEACFEAPGEIKVLVRFGPQAFAHLLTHCAESNEHGREICGLLLGTAWPVIKNMRHGYLLTVTDILPLEATDASGAHVSAHAEAWLQADAEIEERFKGKKRLGWYHTHPTQGIFFSGADKDFHSIFLQPYQFALVVDPRFPELGLFHWQDRAAGQIAGPIPLSPRKEPPLSDLPRLALPGSHRLLLVALGLAGFAGLLAMGRGETGKLLPFAALFIAGLLLRLWNAGAVSGRAPRTLELRSVPVGRILSLGALLPFLVLGIRLAKPLPNAWTELSKEHRAPLPSIEPATTTTEAVPPTTEEKVAAVEAERTGSSRPTEEGPAAPVREARTVSVWVRSSSEVVLFWQDNRVDYVLNKDGKHYALRSDQTQEDALLGYLLGVSNPWAPHFRQIQAALPLATTDGDWGEDSRTVFVQVALERASSGRTLDVRSKNHILSIGFKRLSPT